MGPLNKGCQCYCGTRVDSFWDVSASRRDGPWQFNIGVSSPCSTSQHMRRCKEPIARQAKMGVQIRRWEHGSAHPIAKETAILGLGTTILRCPAVPGRFSHKNNRRAAKSIQQAALARPSVSLNTSFQISSSARSLFVWLTGDGVNRSAPSA